MVNDGLWIILLFVALALVLTCAGIGVSLLLSPHYYHSKEQRETFECGIDTEGTAWVNFRVGYYMYALVFLLFDIETVFFFPLALAFKSVGMFPVLAGTLFLVLLCIGLWYEWKEGALVSCTLRAARSPAPATFALALFESVLLGLDASPFLSPGLDADALAEYLGGFRSVVLTEEEDRVGLVYPRRERVFDVRYFTVETEDGRVCNILPSP